MVLVMPRLVLSVGGGDGSAVVRRASLMSGACPIGGAKPRHAIAGTWSRRVSFSMRRTSRHLRCLLVEPLFDVGPAVTDMPAHL